MVGLSPSELWDMTLADFNMYSQGHFARMRMEEENLIRQAHTQAVMNGLVEKGKLKPVHHYLPKDENSRLRDGGYSLDKSREISAQIEKAKEVYYG